MKLINQSISLTIPVGFLCYCESVQKVAFYAVFTLGKHIRKTFIENRKIFTVFFLFVLALPR